MAHLTITGKPCGMKDGHPGQHYTVEAYLKSLARAREKYYRRLPPERAAELRSKYEVPNA